MSLQRSSDALSASPLKGRAATCEKGGNSGQELQCSAVQWSSSSVPESQWLIERVHRLCLREVKETPSSHCCLLARSKSKYSATTLRGQHSAPSRDPGTGCPYCLGIRTFHPLGHLTKALSDRLFMPTELHKKGILLSIRSMFRHSRLPLNP